MTASKRAVRIAAFATILTLAFFCSGAFCADDEISQKTLKGIKGVAVLVMDFSSELRKVGMSKHQIKTDAELKLRLAGIKIFSLEESIIKPGAPYLHIYTNAFKAGGYFVYNCDVELNQIVSLARNPATKTIASTWSTSMVGINSNPENIRTTVKDLIDRFLNAYLSVNPK